MGTAVGTKVFVEHGWRAASGLSMAWYGWQLFILLLRGPHVQRYTWFGYEGGLEARKKVVMERQQQQQQQQATEAEKSTAAPQDGGAASEKGGSNSAV